MLLAGETPGRNLDVGVAGSQASSGSKAPLPRVSGSRAIAMKRHLEA